MLNCLYLVMLLTQSSILGAFANGDITYIKQHMSDMVLISIDDSMDFYDPEGASVVLESFFSEHPPKSYKQTFHSIQSGNRELLNADLYTSRGTYRLNLVIEKTGDRKVVSEIKLFRN